MLFILRYCSTCGKNLRSFNVVFVGLQDLLAEAGILDAVVEYGDI